ncbi:DUF3551 domain-containing protein [Bradyrhizobium sp. DASA03005]|uniref:DUF3551 domain-containing protein n=3 Tax=Nitrobacteraceae TaxID=41294 RepID=UPI00155E3213|nr:DUF3551 domain-containing protein [Bradyrhizobium liaoningense]MDD1518523.1 hypothetical protein [Bradyrhizobium sp. WBAH30]MDD1542321.1 hypothetical protein [Bradyrhizobium sp. WBAH41]MDD1556473.1 hypothetical protein [Bradyrhizobium sp. WBAH23]MDD1561686.1 hypothetical protein [Bradyrhizobium sp. WBAH33]MDD1589292.1 hypothetical protein [Bradyrhizobium sp. WBAH42]NRB87789.1 hypothetical protein [Bradyrhizobium sp. WBAH10]QCJ92600.1 hypothetical protein DAA57_31990 [Bradyrhizobium yuanmi
MMEGQMRLALLIGVLLMGLSSAANARDYPWCVFGGHAGPPGECMYETREQCLASASGRWTSYCDINPRVRFQQQAPPPTACDSRGRRCAPRS